MDHFFDSFSLSNKLSLYFSLFLASCLFISIPLSFLVFIILSFFFHSFCLFFFLFGSPSRKFFAVLQLSRSNKSKILLQDFLLQSFCTKTLRPNLCYFCLKGKFLIEKIIFDLLKNHLNKNRLYIVVQILFQIKGAVKKSQK